ncbi:MAG TPA: AraC family transcriptional regulator [Steroidobacteraceae bacterium]|jgi:AraC-like DNA-binding protein|nr:AraC family transcriptional regulator [Steroidobacteraceae bacterium]
MNGPNLSSEPREIGAAAAASARSKEPGTIAICFVAAALQSVRARNLNAEELLAKVGLSASLLQVPQARVSAKVYGALWRAIALALDDEFFGQDSRRMKSGSFAMLCHAVVACKSLRDALERSLRFYALILDDISVTLEEHAGEARIILHERAAGAGGRVFAHELLLMLLYGVSCWLVGRRIPILRTEFSYTEPAHSAEYRLMYCADLRFSRPHTLLAFESSYLDLPVVQNEGSVKEFLRTAPENILLKYKNGSSLSARVRRRLRQCLPGEVPDFEELAIEMNMTSATLRRRLHEEGASYQLIKDQLRRDLAIGYLSHSTRSVMDIALELGFSERSAFHRAFRKWTGASPGEFRRNSQG